jgi:hypothetical protein
MSERLDISSTNLTAEDQDVWSLSRSFKSLESKKEQCKSAFLSKTYPIQINSSALCKV